MQDYTKAILYIFFSKRVGIKKQEKGIKQLKLLHSLPNTYNELLSRSNIEEDIDTKIDEI